ncbi:MAG: acyl-CoA thioesterase [Bacteroidetes bacterium]|nr:acyl-CoA thioesterase [Bacteroidota bacterium]
MYSAETQLRVRYGETDKMGMVYYGNYPLYFEVGRTNLMRDLNLTYRSIENNGIVLPVTELSIKYHYPAGYDDLLTIKTTIPVMPSVKILFNYEIFNDDGKLVVTGNTVLVFMNDKTRRPTRPPEDFIEKIKPFFQQSL